MLGSADHNTVWVVFGRRRGEVKLRHLGRQGIEITGALLPPALAGGADFNADGLSDIAVSDHTDYNRHRLGAGSTFMIYGRRSPGRINVHRLGGAGFRIGGISADDAAGSSLAFGRELHGTRRAYLVIGAPSAQHDAGEVDVVWGANRRRR